MWEKKKKFKNIKNRNDYIIKDIYIYYKRNIDIWKFSNKGYNNLYKDEGFKYYDHEIRKEIEIEKKKEEKKEYNTEIINLWKFWFPILYIEIENKETNNRLWILYICTRESYNFHLLNRINIYRIISKNEPLKINIINKYSTNIIIYTKRTLKYYDVVTNNLDNYGQYKYKFVNLFDKIYRYSKIKNNIRCISNDIRIQSKYGLYNSYIYCNHDLRKKKVLNEHFYKPRKIGKEIIKMLKLNKLKVEFLLLKRNEYLFNYLI